MKATLFGILVKGAMELPARSEESRPNRSNGYAQGLRRLGVVKFTNIDQLDTSA